MSDALNAAHQIAIVHTLRSIAPGLAALHAVRLRKQLYAEEPELPPTVSPLTCPRCGHVSLSIRTQHKGKRRNQKVNREKSLIRTCSTCMFAEAVPVPHSAPRFSRKAAAIVLQTSTLSSPNASASALAQQTKSSAEPQHAPKRPHKKKSGLQELLARNRAREEQQRQKQAAEARMKGSLSSFLDGL